MKIKSLLKKNNLIRKTCLSVERKIFALLVKMSPITASKYFYKRSTGKNLNLNNPQDFNEKLQWLKLYWRHPLVVKCADKYEVREYVGNCGCPEILNDLYGVYESVSEIPWNSLPQKFALKTTHGCDMNIICDNKNKLNKEDAFTKLEKWMKTDYSLNFAEIHYSKITPRIICEKYIETDEGILPIDYKIYCFHGMPKLIRVHTGRATNMQRYTVDLKWKYLDIESENCNKGELPTPPKHLQKMIEYAKKLATPFPFVRIDFYDTDDKPILGEMTFTPSGCVFTNFTQTGLDMMGSMITLPQNHMQRRL